jgi:hypothetical protein
MQDLAEAIRFGKISLDLRPPGHLGRVEPVESYAHAARLLSLEKEVLRGGRGEGPVSPSARAENVKP